MLFEVAWTDPQLFSFFLLHQIPLTRKEKTVNKNPSEEDECMCKEGTAIHCCTYLTCNGPTSPRPKVDPPLWKLQNCTQQSGAVQLFYFLKHFVNAVNAVQKALRRVFQVCLRKETEDGVVMHREDINTRKRWINARMRVEI